MNRKIHTICLLLLTLLLPGGCTVQKQQQPVTISETLIQTQAKADQQTEYTQNYSTTEKLSTEETAVKTEEELPPADNIPPPEIKNINLSDRKWDECNSPLPISATSDPDNHARMMKDGHIAFWGDAYVSAEISQPPFAAVNAEWYIGKTEFNPLMQEDFEQIKPMDRYVTAWTKHSTIKNITAVKSCDGKFYLHLATPPIEEGFGVSGTWLYPRKILFISGGKTIAEKQFYLQQ